MAKGDKPAVSVAIKAVGASDQTYLLAGWERDGKVSSLMPDRKVKAIKVMMEDGEVVAITKGDEGKWSHYVNFYDNRKTPAPRPRGGGYNPDDGDDLGSRTDKEYEW